MGTALNTNVIDSYLALLKNLSPGAKLDLIAKLTQSLKADMKPSENLFKSSFGAWQGSESAEQIIADIRNSRTFTRQIEEL
ncbi:hypothetical protein [Chitinophaga cymbidii]|uniref:Uncharacterized protein n=1 Tax=Chitinophaga cymbidii TaxID=1096750 RepID=A0A512RPU0_9BACT|nr:hypothetical protein [Chitinophaga cymbidii]GEP97716.1 hypothetical protein CCY01nite_39760 [Chitinophaga cymbidii]